MLNGWLMTTDQNKVNDYQGDNFISKKDKGKKVTAKKPNFSSIVSKNMQDPTGKHMWLFSGSK